MTTFTSVQTPLDTVQDFSSPFILYDKPADGCSSSSVVSLVVSVSVIGSLAEDTLVESLSFFPQAVTAAAAMHMTRATTIAIKLFFIPLISLFYLIMLYQIVAVMSTVSFKRKEFGSFRRLFPS